MALAPPQIDPQIQQYLPDPTWRMTHLYNIRTKVPGFEGQAVTFFPNRVQQEIYQAIEDGKKRIIILKPRKLGVTTGIVMYLLDKAMYSPNQMCRTIAHRKQTVSELFNDMARFAFDRIPPAIRPEDRYTTRSELDFASIGSKYSIDVEARGMTPTFLHFSEIAYIDDENKLQDSIESLSGSAVGIAESTANGKGGWFYDTFTRNWTAMQIGQEPEWYPMFFPWFSDPTSTLKWGENTQLYYEVDARALQQQFGLSDEQILWWDRKKYELGERMPELYPSTPEEAFIFSTGKVYPEFSTQSNVIEPIRFPDFKVAMDYGQTNPTVFLLIHQDYDGNFIVFDEFYESGSHPSQSAEWLKKKGVKIVDYADPSIFNKTQVSAIYRPNQADQRTSIADEFRNYGIVLKPGTQNDIPAGIARMKEYLKFDITHIHPFRKDAFDNNLKGSPRLFITANCTNLIREFNLYRWPSDPSGALNQNSYEVPIKKDDHAMDALRYAILTWGKPLGKSSAQEPDPRTPAGILARLAAKEAARPKVAY